MPGECKNCGEQALECKCEPSPWPANWRELLDKSPSCHRCGTTLMPKLYLLSEAYPNIEVCHLCSDAYWKHIKEFVKDIEDRKNKRNLERHRPVP